MIKNRTSYLSYKALITSNSYFMAVIERVVSPFVAILFYCMVATFFSNGAKNISILLSNILLLSTYSYVYYMGAAITRDKQWKTIGALFIAPKSMFSIIFDKFVFLYFEGLVIVFLALLATSFFLTSSVDYHKIFEIAVIYLIGSVGCASMGIFLSSICVQLKDRLFFINLVWHILIITSGVIPIVMREHSVLERFLSIFPMNVSSKAIVSALRPGEDLVIIYQLKLQVILAIFYGAASFFSFSLIVKRNRESGVLND